MAWRTTLDDLLDTADLATQGQIVAALKAQGFGVTQATVSRQLATLGVVKRRGFYRHAPVRDIGAPILDVQLGGAGGLAVVRTLPAHASVVAQAIDTSLSLNPRFPGVLGTIAGDDTVFVALASPEAAADLFRFLGWRGADPARGE